MKAVFPAALLAATFAATVTHAAHAEESGAEQRQFGTLDTITVNGGRPSSLPTQIPTTFEGITGAQIAERINATDSEDALKYFPSLNVRKRYAGDFDHAVLASRASGTGNSARSLVYADGILLSNLLGNGATYTPRWGLVTPEEIERVDVLYGPFSAAYPGNSVGAVVDYITRMPRGFEAHAKVSAALQGFDQYASSGRYPSRAGSFSLGDRAGAWSWWLHVNRSNTNAQPLGYANKLVSSGTPGAVGVPVSGAIADKNPQERDWLILGSTLQYHTVQDQAKLKLAYDFAADLTATYTLGWWNNAAERNPASYLRDAAGREVWGGDINVNGRSYRVTPADFAPTLYGLTHVIQGLALKSHAQGEWNWEVAASDYAYRSDGARTPTTFAPRGAGTLTDMQGSGWHTLALKGAWRPAGHMVDFGLQDDRYRLRTLVSGTADWQAGTAGARVSAFNGNAALTSLYAQDAFELAQGWRAMLGLRAERWNAYGGELGDAASMKAFAERAESNLSPKLALARELAADLVLKASLGRALRYPTVAELYQGSIAGNAIVNNDPNLRAEKSWTSELSLEHEMPNGLLRATLYAERTRDALYSQTNVTLTPNVTNIQNVGRIDTVGFELAAQLDDVLKPGLSLQGSLTYADSRIRENANFPQSVGKQQPRVPDWRASFLASYRFSDALQGSLGARYSGRQYGTLDNSDPNGFTYTGVSKFFVVDARLRWKFAPQWSAALGVDNLNNAHYWAFHPYTQRTLTAELKWDY